MTEDFYSQFTNFATDLENRLQGLGFDLESYPLDHACFRVSSSPEYQNYLETFKKNSVLWVQKDHHGRRFNLFVLKTPFIFKSVHSSCLEFSEPGGSDDYQTGFQHIEFHTNVALDRLSPDQMKLKPLIFPGKFGDETYLKWLDKIVVKVTPVPALIKMLTEQGSQILLP